MSELHLASLWIGATLATVGWFYTSDPHNPYATPRENKGWAMILAAVFIAWVM